MLKRNNRISHRIVVREEVDIVETIEVVIEVGAVEVEEDKTEEEGAHDDQD